MTLTITSILHEIKINIETLSNEMMHIIKVDVGTHLKLYAAKCSIINYMDVSCNVIPDVRMNCIEQLVSKL